MDFMVDLLVDVLNKCRLLHLGLVVSRVYQKLTGSILDGRRQSLSQNLILAANTRHPYHTLDKALEKAAASYDRQLFIYIYQR